MNCKMFFNITPGRRFTWWAIGRWHYRRLHGRRQAHVVPSNSSRAIGTPRFALASNGLETAILYAKDFPTRAYQGDETRW
jgi:hypothetical protein